MVKSHYEVLGVPKSASADQIKKSYRKLSLTHHPDRGGDEEEFKKVSEAYQILSDPEKKNNYDNPFDKFFTGGFPVRDSDNLFNSLFGFRAPKTSQTSKNINHKVLLTLEDFYVGKTCKFAISRKVQCRECDGEGGWGKKQANCLGCSGQGHRVSQRGYNSVSTSLCIQCRGKKYKTIFDKVCKVCKSIGVVPQRVVAEAKFEAGACAGDTVILTGMSDCVEGRQPGDVIVTACEKSHRIFRRNKCNLACSIDITLRQSLCGFSAEITHLDRRLVEVKSDTVTPHGHKFVVQGEGIPRGKGCLEITTNVVFPKVVPKSIANTLAECLDVLEKE